ncbi:protein FAM83G isoform X2 [Ctenopharyngodon idella]|uniref:protein FAM83G isoform X2 n=1 Tax=Ctenopharyngodon idella TaxID=7959 RepID=UPI00222E706D|nr:protein FAM83G isoform X2 [Ctenopharyngodon idella]
MSNSQEQSLNENVIFTPLTESSPDFLHCEEERYCVESLVSSGPEAFYTKLHGEKIRSFLSTGEVNQISSWVEDYHQSDAVLEDGNGEVEVGSDGDDFSGHYFPTESDIPAPCLELGWPERYNWMDTGQVHVYTNPPTEQEPSIRVVLRRLLQGATRLIAVVTDKLSDKAVVGDLQNAASRGVPVYIILNRRSAEENCSSHQLQHPNIMVRILGGKTFLTHDTKMVVGELKDNFVLVDLETVMLGSYSLTWSDAHLHRQLVTLMSGPVVESFDREFRTLYAASLPIPESWKTEKPATEPKIYNKLPPLHINSNKIELTDYVSNPPPPPMDSPLDWEAMGVIKRFPDNPLSPAPDATEMQFHHRNHLDRHPGGWEVSYNDFNSRLLPGHQEEGKFNSMFLSDFRHPEYQRQRRHYSPGEMHSNDLMNRHLQIPDRITYPLMNPENEERYPVYKSRIHRNDMTSEEEMRRDTFLRRDRVLGDKINPEGTTQSHLKSSDLSRSKTFSTLSDILKRVNARASSSGQTRAENLAPGISKSTLELNLQRSDTASTARTTNCDNLPLTPALALMKKRNDDVKSGLLRNMPSAFSSGFRTPGFGLQREQWRSAFRSHRSEEEH